MKDSKEKEHRISNLKDMIDNISEPNVKGESEEFEEDIELINYLNEEQSNYDYEIDDEYIYHPDEDKGDAINLEENPINEDYIINAPKEKELENKDSQENEDIFEDFSDDISESFDNLINAKVGRTPIIGVISSILGLILIAFSAYLFSIRSDRVIDNVVSGETNFYSVIVLIFGLLLLIYGLFKVFGFRNPLGSLSDSMNSIDNDKVKETPKKKEEPAPKVIPKSNIPLDKESYKIGEFDIGDLKNKLKRPSKPKKPTPPTQEELDQIPPAREKPKEKKGLTTEEIEEIEYEQVVRDSETIDDIFAEVEDIDDMPIISIDSEEKKKNN